MSVASLKIAPTVDEFMNAGVKRDIVRAKIIKQLRDVPILLSPVCATPAFQHGRRKLAPGLRLSRHDAACAVVESGGFSGCFSADGIFSGRIANWCASDWQAERG